MLQHIAYKYRLVPTEEQKVYFSKCFGCVRLVYNRYVAFSKEDNARVKAEGGKYSELPTVKSFKEELEFLKEVDSLALSNARQFFEGALKGWWKSLKGKRKGKKLSPPKFKKKGISKDSYTTNNQNGTISVTNNIVKLPKIGEVKFINHRPIEDGYKIKSATISREKDGAYFISILCDREYDMPLKRAYCKPMEERNVVGLDMSLNEFYVSSDQCLNIAKTKYVRQYRKDERKLARANRQHSRKKMIPTDELVFSKRYNKMIPKREPSSNREKSRLKLARLHRRIANRRRDFVIQEAVRLAKAYDAIVIEGLNMQAMSRTLHLGKSVNDLGWGMFKQWLAIQCDKRGCELVVADKWFPSSKTCNHCGTVNKELKLSEREWVCKECGCINDRDYNAACNLRDWYIKNYNTGGTPGINACGDSASIPQCNGEQVGSVKQEAPNLTC